MYEHESAIARAPYTWYREHGKDMKVKDWIIPAWEQGEGTWDATLLGVPLSRSSISASAASEFPAYFRKAWELFSTYYIDEQVDFRDFQLTDVGNVKMHWTDILQCHRNIELAMEEVIRAFPNTLYTTVGGDHSITAPLVRAYQKQHPDKKIGILQFDTHLDLRDYTEQGPTNGTPIRQLVEQNIVKGENVYNIGLHGFYNAPSLIEAANKHQVNMITLRTMRKNGPQAQIEQVMRELTQKVDAVYVTVDMDVLDVAYAPGVPASTPGGMRTDELFDLLFEVGKYDTVKAIDFVCIDPHRDQAAFPTVKSTVYAYLTFIVSRYLHIK